MILIIPFLSCDEEREQTEEIIPTQYKIIYHPINNLSIFNSSKDTTKYIFNYRDQIFGQNNVYFRNGNFSPDGQKFIFEADIQYGRNGGSREMNDIFIYHTELDSFKNLTRDGYRQSYPSFSNNGEKIVYISNETGNDEVFIMNMDGDSKRMVTNNNLNSIKKYPKFLNDGKRILFQSHGKNSYKFYSTSIDDIGLNNIFETKERIYNCIILQDETHFIFNDLKAIYKVNINTKNIEIFIREKDVLHMTLSPDNNFIAYKTFYNDYGALVDISSNNFNEQKIDIQISRLQFANDNNTIIYSWSNLISVYDIKKGTTTSLIQTTDVSRLRLFWGYTMK